MAPLLRTARPAAVVLICAAASPISPANAQTFSSSYTSTAPKDCRTIGKPNNGVSTTQVCPGKSGLVVLISEDDLRQTVSVGRNRAQAARGAGRGGLVRPLQFHRQYRRMAGGGRQAVRDHSALADRRQ